MDFGTGHTAMCMLAHARRGTERVGRTLGTDFYTAAMVTLVMLQPL